MKNEGQNIYIGDAKCTECGKKHKKVFEIEGKPYGSSCAKTILGKELNAPIWLYQLAEEYVQNYGIEQEDIKNGIIEDFEVNFWNTRKGLSPMGYEKVYEKSIKIGEKCVTV